MQAGERREQLLDATKAIVAERGFHAVSIEAVARAAGITRPIVYGHFRDLPGVLEALVKRETARALAQLRIMSPDELAADPRVAMLASLSSYLEAVREDPTTWRLVLMPPEGAPAMLRDAISLGRTAVVEQIEPRILAEVGRDHRRELGQRAQALALDECLEQARQVAEVPVDDRARDAGGAGHGLHRDGVEALLHDDPLGHVEQLLAAFGGGESSGRGRHA